MSRATDDAREEGELTIDELAAKSGVPSRTIRFYQSKGVLAPPRIRGRVAYYSESHASRLTLIARLQDRGLRMDAIRELVSRMDKGELDVGDWLGLSDELGAPWADDVARTVTEEELRELAGTSRPGLVADLLRNATIERAGDRYLLRSPGLLSFAMRLESVGIDLASAKKAHDILRRHLGRAAQELAAHFVADASAKDSDVDFAEVARALRHTGLDAVRLVFAREMEAVLGELVRSGKSTRIGRGRKKK